MTGDWKIPDPTQRPSGSVPQQRPSQFGSSMRNSTVRPAQRSFPIALTIFLIAILLPIFGMFAYMLVVPALKNVSSNAPVTEQPKLVWLQGDEANSEFGEKWSGATIIDRESVLKYGTSLWDLHEQGFSSNNPDAVTNFQQESKALFSTVFGDQGLIGFEIPLSLFNVTTSTLEPSKLIFEVSSGTRNLSDGGERLFKILLSTKIEQSLIDETILTDDSSQGKQTVRLLIVPYYAELSEERKNVRSLDFDNQSKLGHMNKWITSSTVEVKITADFAGAQITKNNVPQRSLIKGHSRSSSVEPE
ncbi:MAG: hypothetical protein KDD66_06000 [Bdellovibrionales bacterium]|nr:hypothetical protein [Bdellovibrionales bacterium]